MNAQAAATYSPSAVATQEGGGQTANVVAAAAAAAKTNLHAAFGRAEHASVRGLATVTRRCADIRQAAVTSGDICSCWGRRD